MQFTMRASFGAPKMAIFGLQHMFAMFGATILVPVLTGLPGLHHAAVRRRGHAVVPSAFEGEGAGVPGIVVRFHCRVCGHRAQRRGAICLPYACLGVACAGLFVPGACPRLFKVFGRQARHALLPAGGNWRPSSSPSGSFWQALPSRNASTNWALRPSWPLRSSWCATSGARGMIKIIPILLGVARRPMWWRRWCGEVDFTSRRRSSVDRLCPSQWDCDGVLALRRELRCGLGTHGHHHHHAAGAGHHDRAYRRHLGHQLHLQPQLHSRSRACIARFSATVWPPSWRRSSALRPTPRTARTPACWL